VSSRGYGWQLAAVVDQLQRPLLTRSMSVSPYPQSNLLIANFSAHCKDMRVKWAKTRARAKRWSEEIILLNEEMQCVLQYLNWKATCWLQQQGHRADASPDIRDGIDAYAAKQADLVL
jgi:hypothetical protein